MGAGMAALCAGQLIRNQPRSSLVRGRCDFKLTCLWMPSHLLATGCMRFGAYTGTES